MDEKTIHKTVVLTLIRIGIKCDQAGFDYLVGAVEMVISNPKLLQNTRKLLAEVAKKCEAKSAGQVEASINNSINYTHATGKFAFLNTLYGMDVIEPNIRPNIAQLTRLVAEYVTLGVYKHKYSRADFLTTPV